MPQSPETMVELSLEEAASTDLGLSSLADISVERSGDMETQPNERTVAEPDIVLPAGKTSSRDLERRGGFWGVLFVVGGALTGLWLLAGAAQMLVGRAGYRV